MNKFRAAEFLRILAVTEALVLRPSAFWLRNARINPGLLPAVFFGFENIFLTLREEHGLWLWRTACEWQSEKDVRAAAWRKNT